MVSQLLCLQIFIHVSKKTSILDTTTTKPNLHKISDDQRYLRRFYVLDKLKCLEDFWFDLQCICLDTQLGKGLRLELG